MKWVILLRHQCRDPILRLRNQLYIRAYAYEIEARFVDLSWSEHLLGVNAIIAIARRLIGSHAWLWWTSAEPFFLPPTQAAPIRFRPDIERARVLFFCGWSFYNPEGLTKYSDTLRRELGFTKIKNNTIRIGVHIRTQPYSYFAGGSFLVSRQRTEEIINEYLATRSLQKSTVIIEYVNNKEDLHNMRQLASCDVVVGPNRPFCDLAAWLGDAPYIIATNAQISWDMYTQKLHYFNNPLATGVLGLNGED